MSAAGAHLHLSGLLVISAAESFAASFRASFEPVVYISSRQQNVNFCRTRDRGLGAAHINGSVICKGTMVFLRGNRPDASDFVTSRSKCHSVSTSHLLLQTIGECVWILLQVTETIHQPVLNRLNSIKIGFAGVTGRNDCGLNALKPSVYHS